MNITENKKLEILTKKKKLTKVTKKLKKEFVGLDDIIDELINDIQTWYLFPEGQIRPTIINLWGLTGTGKTSLVQRLFKHLELNDELYKFNVGDYAGESDTKLSYVFSNELKQKEKMPIGIMFDEFQLGRTLNEDGVEIQKSGLRTIWDLLDSGMLEYLDYNWFGSKILRLLFLLEKCHQLDVGIKQGVVIENLKEYKEVFNIREEVSDNVDDDDDEISSDNEQKEYVRIFPQNFIITSEFHYALKSCDDKKFYSDTQIVKFFSEFDDIREICDYLDKMLRNIFKPRLYDYTKSIIFIIGNLDEAYEMTSEVSPDNDADLFHKHSLSIKIADIKAALRKRFRVEQIGRLGNNHIIYRAFSSKTYRDLIKLELNRIKKKANDDYGISIFFDKTINDIIYKEGVFPTLGTRPVFTTINTLIESALSKITLDIALSDKRGDIIVDWGFIKEVDNCYHIVNVSTQNDLLFTKKYDAKLKLEADRKPTGDENQLLVAVHESGHAVLDIIERGVIPDAIISRTSGGNVKGLCISEHPELKVKEWYRQDIVVCFGGLLAEKMVFGDDFVSDGSSSDLSRLTNNAILAGQQYGMLSEHISIGVESLTQQYLVYKDTKPTDIEARNWINVCYSRAEKVLMDNKKLLCALTEKLTDNSRIEKNEIVEILEKLGYRIPKKDMKNYYALHAKFDDFKSIV